MTTRERCQKAMEYHEKGLNCGQSVLAAFTDITGFTICHINSINTIHRDIITHD